MRDIARGHRQHRGAGVDAQPAQPVHVGGVTVHPGDLVHGDRNGVTTIPVSIASATAHACADYMAAESVVMDYLKGKNLTAKGFAEARNECKNRIDALAKRA